MGNCVSKNLDKAVRLQFEKSNEWMREESDYKGLQKARVAHPAWPAYQPRHFFERNEFLVTH